MNPYKHIALCRSFGTEPKGSGSQKSEIKFAEGEISAAQRIAAAHRAGDTNAPSGRPNQTPGEGVCVSHVAACAVLGPPAPPKAPHNLRVPAKGQADRAAAWAHGASGTRAPEG